MRHDRYLRAKAAAPEPPFPPRPYSKELLHTITSDFIADSMAMEEAACGVCAELKPTKNLTNIRHVARHLPVLAVADVAIKDDGSRWEEDKPVLIPNAKYVCSECRPVVTKGVLPRLALANNLWIGEVPFVLRRLRYFERLLIQRVRHNALFVKVAGGYRKAIAHVISFPVESEKIYETLPPPKGDIEKVLAIMFTGPTPPSVDDYKSPRFAPLLVRHHAVRDALQYLIAHTPGWDDITVDEKALAQYSESVPPVTVVYRSSASNIAPEGRSSYDVADEHGVETGEIPFQVHGLT
ncbi:hypothetical protein FB107DRAFT_211808, partial [Schizophyllum commune]